MKRFIITYLLLASTATIVNAQVARTDSAARGHWAQFNQAHEQRLKVVWDKASGRFSNMLGTTRSFGRTPDEAISNFINLKSSLLGLSDNHKLKQLNRLNTQNGQVKFRFQQTYNDIPVLNSGYLISVTETGEIDYISGNFYEGISLEVQSELSAGQVTSAIETDLGESAFDFLKEPELSIWPLVTEDTMEVFVLVWHARVRVKDQPVAWRYYIDVENGTIIEKKSLVKDLLPLKLSSVETDMTEKEEVPRMIPVNGTGTVYQVSPNYGSGTVTRTLHRLDNVSPRKLEGLHVSVDYYNQSNATSPTGSFNYSTSNAHFDEVMVYYHSDEFEDWLIGKGLDNSQVDEVLIRTRFSDTFASTVAEYREVFFGTEDAVLGLNNPTWEAAIITHEYMHVVSGTYYDFDTPGHEQAMDEAYSDYFALAYRNDFNGLLSSVIGEYVDQTGGFDWTRNLDNSWTMDDYSTIDLEPNFTTDEHDRSVIFSGALWDFRGDGNVNPEVADELVLKSLGNLGPSTDFLDGMYALMAAAINSSYSDYVDDIEYAFGTHGISEPVSVYISGPGHISSGFGAHYTANPSGGVPSYSYQWKKDGVNVGTSNTYYLSTYPFDEGTVTLSVTVTDNFNKTATDNFPVFVDPYLKRSVLPTEFSITVNYPNPFNPSTNISYELPEVCDVIIKVYNLMGQEVTTLINSSVQAGFHEITFDAGGLSSGFYIAKIQAVGASGKVFNQELKMQLIK